MEPDPYQPYMTYLDDVCRNRGCTVVYNSTRPGAAPLAIQKNCEAGHHLFAYRRPTKDKLLIQRWLGEDEILDCGHPPRS